MDRDQELEEMKRIDLRLIAADWGFDVNRKRSSRNSIAMDGPAGERILIGLGQDGHYVYYNVHDTTDAGSAIDFVQRRQGGTLGTVRKLLRPYLVGGERLTASAPLPPLQPVARDVLALRRHYEAFKPVNGYHAYLCEERMIPAELLAQPKFAERLRIDDRGNAVFPHYTDQGLVGWEARGPGFVSFSKGGQKALWCSVPGSDDQTLVLAEGSIDALSYAVLAGHSRSRFISFSGALNKEQPALIAQAIAKMPMGSMIVAAIDNDDAGDQYVAVLEELFRSAARVDLTFRVDRPERRGQDWNDALTTPLPRPAGKTRSVPRPE